MPTDEKNVQNIPIKMESYLIQMPSGLHEDWNTARYTQEEELQHQVNLIKHKEKI